MNTDTSWPDTPTTTSSASSSHNHGSSSSNAGSMFMSMTFFTSSNTPLYSTSWTPSSNSSYAGTCIFLIILACVLRCLFALKHVLERRWLDQHLNRRYIVVAGKANEAQTINEDVDAKSAMLISPNGVEENVKVVRRHGRPVMPWRLTVDLPRALLVTVMAGVGYLLMLAVMTFNIGYFFSVLGGVFVGELAVGRYVHAEDH